MEVAFFLTWKTDRIPPRADEKTGSKARASTHTYIQSLHSHIHTRKKTQFSSAICCAGRLHGSIRLSRRDRVSLPTAIKGKNLVRVSVRLKSKNYFSPVADGRTAVLDSSDVTGGTSITAEAVQWFKIFNYYAENEA